MGHTYFAPMFSIRHTVFFSIICGVYLALAGDACAQAYGPGGRDFSPSTTDWDKKKTTPATGVEIDGVYQETEVRHHSWFSSTKPAEMTPADQLSRGDRFQAKNQLKSAGKAYRALVITWPRSMQAPVAQQRYAETLAARGRIEDAFEEYDKLIDKYTGSFDYEAVIEEQFRLAKLVMARRKGTFLFFGGFKAPERAIPLFESLLRHAPRWEGAAEAQYLIGQCNEMIDEYELAMVAYMSTQNRYPESPYAEKAAHGRARCLFNLAKENPNDEETLDQAYAAAVVFLGMYPQSDAASEVTGWRETLLRRRAQIAYNRGVFYDQIARKPKAALMSYENFVSMYPNAEWTKTAKARIDELRPLVEKVKKQ